jgi:hypothetical protein
MKTRAALEFAAFSLCLFLALSVLGHCATGCTPPKSTAEATAESVYAAELQACVAQYAHAEDIDACAQRVRARWLVDGGPP